MDRSSFLVDPIIGHPYGSQFELHKGALTRLHTTTASTDDLDQSCVSSAGSDNRHINDDAGKAQLLSQEKIAEMKSAGISGQVWDGLVWPAIVVSTILSLSSLLSQLLSLSCLVCHCHSYHHLVPPIFHLCLIVLNTGVVSQCC